ncbi:MAG: Ig-like domain-containing protein, partial [Gemmatimonadales bacterium]
AANNTLTGRTVTWTSSDPTVAVVLGSGAVNTVAIGTTNIIATVDGVAGSASLTVAPMPVATVNVTLTTATLAPGRVLCYGLAVEFDRGCPHRTGRHMVVD